MTLNDSGATHLLSRLQFHLGCRAAEKSLLGFTRQAWSQVEPSRLDISRHIECLSEHLEAVAYQQCLRLLINMPPRHMKSLLANVFFPAWVWAKQPYTDGNGAPTNDEWSGPGVKFLHVTHKLDLTTRDSIKCRRLIESPWYQANWGPRFALLPDQNQKTHFGNDKGGYRLSGTMTSVTGHGANIIFLDDAHDVMQVESPVQREEVIRFYSEQLPNRLNPEGPGAIVIIMQRTHSRDLSGYIIANEFGAELCDISEPEWAYRWRHLCLPARYEKDHPHPMRTDVICSRTREIWEDNRQEGEALWPKMFPIEELERRSASMSEYAIAGQLQQRPMAREGGMFKRVWLEGKFIESIDIQPGTKWVRHWDLASSAAAEASYTVGLKLGRMPDGRFVVGDVIRVQAEGPEVRQLIKTTADQDGRHCEVSLPKDPGQAGKVQAIDFAKMLAGWIVHAEAETGDKATRAEPVAAQAYHGNLLIKRANWNDDLIEELCLFPAAAHDDQVDALSGAFARLLMPIGEFSWSYIPHAGGE